MKLVATGESWDETLQRSYANCIEIEVAQNRLNMLDLEEELAGGFISPEDYERFTQALKEKEQ